MAFLMALMLHAHVSRIEFIVEHLTLKLLSTFFYFAFEITFKCFRFALFSSIIKDDERRVQWGEKQLFFAQCISTLLIM